MQPESTHRSHRAAGAAEEPLPLAATVTGESSPRDGDKPQGAFAIRDRRRGTSPAPDAGSPPTDRPGARRAGQIEAQIKKLTAGDLLELRLAETWFWEGTYARRGVNLQRHLSEPLQVTDLDVLGYSFGPLLRRHKMIAEAKGGTGRNAPRPLDRVIWLRGLLELVDANEAELVSAIVPSDRVRELATTLRVTAQSVDDLKRREQAAAVAEVADAGSQGPTAAAVAELTRLTCATEPEMERAFWFLRSEVWFLDEFTAAKRVVGLIRRVSERWTPAVRDDGLEALRWVLAEAISIFTLQVVSLAALYKTLGNERFSTLANDRLAEGVAPAHLMRRLSTSIDKYVDGLLASVNAPAASRVQAMGAFEPKPPEYASQLIELTRRVAEHGPSLADLPRLVDVVVYETLVRQREVPAAVLTRFEVVRKSHGTARQILAFLKGQAGLPAPLADLIAGAL